MRISWRNQFLLIACLVLVSTTEGGKHGGSLPTPTPAPTEHHGRGQHNNNNNNNNNNIQNNNNNNNPVPATPNPTKAHTGAPTTLPTALPTALPTTFPTEDPLVENAEDIVDDEEDVVDDEEEVADDEDEEEDNEADAMDEDFDEEQQTAAAGKELKDELKEEAKEDFGTAQAEFKDFWNQTAHEGFDSWYHGQDIPAEGTMPFDECEEYMEPSVQTYWDLIYAMIFFTMVTILAPYLVNCVMSQHSYILMRMVALVYYVSAIIHIISGLMLLSALLPQCPVECGANFCTLGEYQPGTLPGLIVFFAGVIWLSMAITTQCKAARAEREYIYEQHLKMGGTATADVSLTAEEQHVNHMNAAAMRAKPRTRPGGMKASETAELI